MNVLGSAFAVECHTQIVFGCAEIYKAQSQVPKLASASMHPRQDGCTLRATDPFSAVGFAGVVESSSFGDRLLTTPTAPTGQILGEWPGARSRRNCRGSDFGPPEVFVHEKDMARSSASLCDCARAGRTKQGQCDQEKREFPAQSSHGTSVVSQG